MKKNFRFAFLSAMALVGTAGFVACTSSDEVVDNPDYNPDTKTVRTTISLNIDPNNSVGNTRQTAATTQASGNFRGMQNLYLFTAEAEIGASSALSGCLQLDAIAASELSSEQSSKIYSNQEVPVGTSHFLFYGKAFKTSETTPAAKLANGHTESSLAPSIRNVSGINFNAVSIVAKNTSGVFPDNWVGPVNALATYLNSIAGAEGWSTSTNTQLAFLYQNFTKANAYRGGSANAVLATVQELYKAVYPISVGVGVDATSKTTASKIIDKILQSYVKWDDGSAGLDILFSWKDGFDSNFPVSLGLPEGAAQYTWNGTEFTYLVAPVLNASTATPLENYVYPSELFYLTNSPLWATATPVVTWPNNVAGWRGEAWSGWTNSVSATTKNIAVQNNIQYGTALLVTRVQCVTAGDTSEGSTKVLYDNAKANGADQNTPIVYKDNMFPLTGIIVGGQPEQVGWDFLPTSANFNRDVYDGTMNGNIYANNNAFSLPNYTLVYDNLSSDATQSDVNICLEFTNNSGSDFYGKDGMILKGQKFYLVAKLALSAGSGTLDFNETRTFFPSTTRRIFIQDFKTIADITLTAGDATTPGAIGDAIPTIPDLRTSQQSLGISVDLEWKPGLTFSVNI